jgi:hypothetical protein
MRNRRELTTPKFVDKEEDEEDNLLERRTTRLTEKDDQQIPRLPPPKPSPRQSLKPLTGCSLLSLH